MRKTGIISGAFAVAVGILSMVSTSAHAVAATCTWTGLGGDYKFSTPINWSGCNNVAPQTGDSILFSSWVGPVNGATSNTVYLTNDLAPSVTLGGVVVDGPSSNGNIYEVDKIVLSSGAIFQEVQQISGGSLTVYADQVSSSGVVTLDGSFARNLNAGSATMLNNARVGTSASVNMMTLKSGSSIWSGVTNNAWSLGGVKNITIENGSGLVVCAMLTDITKIDSNFTFGGGTGSTPTIDVQPCAGADGQPTLPTAGLELNGSITLLSDATISTTNKKLVANGSLVANGHKLTLAAGQKTIVMGKGVLGDVVLNDGSIIAPGASPGCLTTGTITWTQGAQYSFDLGGTTVCTEYDQIKAVGTVNLGNGTLVINQYGGFVPKKDDVFTIIDNDGADAVSGIFIGHAEGSVFTQNGVQFKISYKGGDGNDVTLTVMNKPTAPNTGFALLQANPLMTGIAAVAAAGALLVIGRKLQTARR